MKSFKCINTHITDQCLPYVDKAYIHLRHIKQSSLFRKCINCSIYMD